MRTFVAVAAAFMIVSSAHAQTTPTDPNMKCVDYIAMEKQAGTYGKPTGDKDADAMNKKVDDYCAANPQTLASDAVMKAMGM